MAEKNEHYQIEITDISSDGNGVGTVDGMTVFVPSAAIGDIAEIVIVKVLSHYAIGRIINLIKPSNDRVQPLCAAYKRCGGCQLQHIDYDSQLKIKKNFIDAALERIGGFKNFKCDKVIGMDEPIRYRNKCIFPIGKDKENNIISGFYARRSHEITVVDDCVAGDEINQAIVRAVREYMNECSVSVYDEIAHSGLVRRVFIRTAKTTGEIMTVLSVNGTNIPKRERLIKKLRAVSDKIVSIYININEKKSNNVLGDKNKLIYGKETIEDTLCGIRFKISPHSFYQINPYMTEKLYSKALEYANITNNDNILDVYCGIGTISLAAAKSAGHVTGIEIVEQAIADAKENAKDNCIDNADFFAGSAEETVPRLIENGMKPDTVILDPPRKGSDESTLSAIVSAKPQRIVYVSCNASTLARDMRFLAEHGYTPQKCIGFDMFPHTCHVECVTLMSRVEK
jgi:23S rRNA (uracil1939-C5)-methyltransferase